jgi:probable HAF family extracellular repeat protein
MRHLRSIRFCALCATSLLAAVAAPDYSFKRLGGTSFTGMLSATNGVSADAMLAVGSADFGHGLRAVRWSLSGKLLPLGGLPGQQPATSARAISPDGLFIVGQTTSANGFEAYRWSSSGMIGLGDLPGTGGFSSFATAVSNSGVVVGASQRPFGPSQYAAFRWTPATGMQHLGEFEGGDIFSIAFDVSADGSVIVGSSSGFDGQEAFVWTMLGGMVGLGDLPGGFFGSRAQAVSLDGKVVVGGSDSSRGSEAFRWTALDGMVGLGDIPGGSFSSGATDVSADGSVIVGSASGFMSSEAFVWTQETGIVSLKQYLSQHGVTGLSGWALLYANGISGDGRTIVGTGVNPQGGFEGWVATIEIDPTPIDMGEEVPPSALSVPLGLVSGGMSEFSSSDDRYVRLRAKGKNLMQMVVEGVFTTPLATMVQLDIESYTTRLGTRRQTELFDFSTGNWVFISDVGVPTWEGFNSVMVTTNVARFIEPGTRRVRARLTWQHPTAKGGQQTDVFVDTVVFARVP